MHTLVMNRQYSMEGGVLCMPTSRVIESIAIVNAHMEEHTIMVIFGQTRDLSLYTRTNKQPDSHPDCMHAGLVALFFMLLLTAM